MKKSLVGHAAIATTHLDLQNEALTKSALDSTARQVNEHPVWMSVEHDYLLPPVGVFANAEVRARDDSHHEVVAEQFLFDPDAYPLMRDLAVPDAPVDPASIEVPALPPDAIPGHPPVAVLSYNPHAVDPSEVAAVLSSVDAPVDADGVLMRKSFGATWELVVAFGALPALYYFGKAFGTRLGEHAADAVAAAAKDGYSAIALSVRRMFSETSANGPRVLCIQIELPSGIIVHGHSKGLAPKQASMMMESGSALWLTALAMEQQMVDADIDQLHFRYSTSTGQWLPLYCTSRGGEVYVRDRSLVDAAFEELSRISHPDQLHLRDAEPEYCPLTTEMLRDAGVCHELDYPSMAARVGEANVQATVASALLEAVEQQVVKDAEQAVERDYSVWVGQKPGVNGDNQSSRLILVYVVSHRVANASPSDHETGSASPAVVDGALADLPEYVRTEYGNALWDGAKPWLLVQGNAATRIDADALAYRLVADEVLSGFWEGQYRLKEAAGDAAHMGNDEAQMGRGAMGYLRAFLRGRRYFTQFDLPDHRDQPGLVPGWIADYFDNGGVLYHTQDWERNHETVLLALTEWPELVLNAPVGWALDVDETGTRLIHRLVFEDAENGDLDSQFVYNPGDIGDLEEFASLAVQDEFRIHVFTADEEDGYAWVGTRTIAPHGEPRLRFARMIAPFILQYAPNAELTRLRANDVDDALDDAAHEDAMDDDPLDLLDNRAMRARAVQVLCRKRDPRYAPQICDVVQKMTWAEVNQVWESLALLGEGAVEEFVRLIDKPKRKAAAACGMRALGRIPCRRSLEVLAAQVQEHTSKAEPTEALVDLGEYAVPTLLKLTQDPKGEVRQMAAYALGKIGAVQARDRVAEMAESDRSGKVREVAERALAWLDGDEECKMDLRDFLDGLEVP